MYKHKHLDTSSFDRTKLSSVLIVQSFQVSRCESALPSFEKTLRVPFILDGTVNPYFRRDRKPLF